jgi:rubrerythrin
MRQPIEVGNNRTGIKRSPLDAKRAVSGAQEGGTDVTPGRGPVELEQARLAFSREAEPVGTMPPPVGIKGATRTLVDKVRGQTPEVLLDLLGARLAFERTGTRLYEALLVKHGAASVHPGGPTREELEIIREDELRHFRLLETVMRELGGDPTAVTPSADVMAVASAGIGQVLADPRTTLTQGLEAILMAELVDNDSWQTLITLCDELGEDELAEKFRLALHDEARHLVLVRKWLNTTVRGQAGAD